MPLGDQNYGCPTVATITFFTEPMVAVTSPPLFNPHAAGRDWERARCLAILRKIVSDCERTYPDEVLALNLLDSAINQIESGDDA